jgi:hypothetical protein
VNIKECHAALIQVAQMLDWEYQLLQDFHDYAQKFGASPGINVFDFVLRDALAARKIGTEEWKRIRLEADERRTEP